MEIDQKIPPIAIPTNKELYTSFVISARPIATIGGTSAQNDEYIFGTYSFPPSAANTVIAPHAKIMRQVSTAKSNFFLFLITLSFVFFQKNTMNNFLCVDCSWHISSYKQDIRIFRSFNTSFMSSI